MYVLTEGDAVEAMCWRDGPAAAGTRRWVRLAHGLWVASAYLLSQAGDTP